MTDVYNTNRGDHLGMKHQQQDHQYQHQYPQHDNYNYNYNYSSNEPRAHQVVKAATAVTVGGSLLVLSGLILAGTVIALTIATPLLVIFSPVLVPAVITVFLLATGFLTSGGFGVAAATVLAWMYRYVTSEQPRGSNTLDDVTHKLGAKGRDLRDKVGEHAGRTGGHYGTGGVHHTGGGGVGVGAGAYS